MARRARVGLVLLFAFVLVLFTSCPLFAECAQQQQQQHRTWPAHAALASLWNPLSWFRITTGGGAKDTRPGDKAKSCDAQLRAQSSMRRTDQAVRELNLVYVKTPKCGSTTTAAMMRRIAWRHGLQGFDAPTREKRWISSEPGVWASHMQFASLESRFNSLSRPSFLVSLVREPAARCLSEFYHFAVLMGGVEPTVQNKLKKLQACGAKMLYYIRPKAVPRGCPVERVLDYYDFVGNIDRAVDSYLLLKNLLHLDYADVLFSVAKNHTTARHDASHTPLHAEPKEVQDFVANEFPRLAARDYELLALVDKRMDQLIAGIPDWAEQKQEYTRLLDVVHSACPVDSPCVFSDSTNSERLCSSRELCIRQALGAEHQEPSRVLAGPAETPPGARNPHHRQLQQAQQRPSAPTVFYMHVYKTGGTSVKHLLGACAGAVCRAHGSEGARKAPTRALLGMADAEWQQLPPVAKEMGCLQPSEEGPTKGDKGFLDFTTWSRGVSCALTDNAKEKEICGRLGRTGNDSAAMVRFPVLRSQLQTYPIVAGHTRYPHVPPWMLQRDVRITTLRDPLTTWVSAVLFATKVQPTGPDLTSLTEVTEFVSSTADALSDDQVFTGQLQWFCPQLPWSHFMVFNIRTDGQRTRIAACTTAAIKALRSFNFVGVLEKPANTATLLQHHLGHICPWNNDHLGHTHDNQAAVSTDTVLAALPEAQRKKLDHFVRYDRQLYDAAVQYNEELVARIKTTR